MDTPVLLGEALQFFTLALERAGVENARCNAEWIFCHVLRVTRADLILDRGFRHLSQKEREKLEKLISRRAMREPLQYILGETSFCGYEIETVPGVLVPRPETELLAERAADFLKKRKEAKILDYCTGSACIAVVLAKFCPETNLYAIDISENALEIAARNLRRHSLCSRIHLIKGDSLRAAEWEAPFDLIISNPPYIPTGEIERLEPEVSRYEPREALDGGVDGLDFYRQIAEQAPEFLKKDGVLMAEFGDGQWPEIKNIFEQKGWEEIISQRDYCKKERFFIAKYFKNLHS